VNATRWLHRFIRLFPVVVLLAVANGALATLPANAAPASPLACHASMSNAHPADYSTTYVRVSTVGGAAVTTVAHYASKNTTHYATANSAGKAVIAYKISRATHGFRIVVSIKVQKSGRSGSCSTSFTP
jgi:ABC-type transport system involved in cytochrome c biogenesis permease subunit